MYVMADFKRKRYAMHYNYAQIYLKFCSGTGTVMMCGIDMFSADICRKFDFKLILLMRFQTG